MISKEVKAQFDPLMFVSSQSIYDCDSSLLTLTNTTDSTQSFYYQWEVDFVTINDPYYTTPVYFGVANGSTVSVTLMRYQDPNYQIFVDSIHQDIVINDTCQNINLATYSYYQVNGFDCNSGTSLVSFNATQSGGSGPYGYQWQHFTAGGFFISNFFVNNNPTHYINVSEGDSIYLTVYDDNMNTASYGQTVTLNQTVLDPLISYNVISSDCNNTVIEFFGDANDPNAFYYWSIQSNNNFFSETQQSFTMSFPSNAQFLVVNLEASNAIGCFGINTITIPITPSSISGTYSYTNTSSNPCAANQCDYEVTLSSNGVAPFIYNLNTDSQTTATFTNLCEGTYTGSIEDANGCMAYVNFQIIDSGAMYVQENNYFASCDSNGTGGGNSYMSIQTNQQNTVTWSDGFVGSFYSNPAPGSYNYIVSDPNTGCSVSGTIVVPSSNCYTISGNVYVDLDGDCIFNNNDYELSSVWVDLADANGTWLWMYDYTDANGNFSITAPAGTYYFDVNGYNTNGMTQSCPASGFSVTVDANNPNAVVNFFLTPPAPVQDLSVSLYSFTTFTPGFPYWAFATYCNDGTMPMSGSVVMNYDANLTYLAGSSTSLSSHDAVNHTLTWNFTNLAPGACYTVYPDFTTSVSAVLGTTMNNTIVVNPIPGDATPANNTAYVIDTVVGSWDPNDKAVYPNGNILPEEKDHNYTIRFQNEGTAPAVLVVVRDDLDDNLDIQTLRNVSSSHNFVLTVENTDELVFTFNNIMLPAKQDDEPGSQGSINFSISQKENLPLGTVINNTAEIFFDFNEPIVTNTTENVIVEKTTSIKEVSVSNEIMLYPNPTQGVFYVTSETGLDINSITVYDILGAKVFETEGLNNKKAIVNLQNLEDGIYMVKVKTRNGTAIKKVNISKK